jgi:predicted AlkP superfamily pyrophosphatase or phosphodiesterase
MKFALLFCSLVCSLPALSAPAKVVMISIDGLKGVTLAHLPERNANTPNLNEFVKGGAVSEGLIGVFPTVTYPSHTTLITGVPPAAHGILGNGLFDPDQKLKGAWYWYSEEIKTRTLWSEAKQKGMTTASVSWPVTVGAKIDFNFPEFRFLRTYEDIMLFRGISTPGLLAEYEQAEGKVAAPVDDDTRTKLATYLIRKHQPDLLLVHLADMDHEQHLHGPDSPDAIKSLESIDACIGRIRKEVQSAGLDKRTVFVIVSDHGFLPVDQSIHPNSVLDSIGLLGPGKHPEQWRVSAFSNGASFGLVVHDPADHEAIELATKTFESMKSDGRYGIDRVFSGEDLKQTGGYTNSFLAVTMKSGFSVNGSLSGKWITSSADTAGMHGFAPGPRELDASFVAFGPGIPQTQLDRAQLTDVATTVAAILGMPWTQGNGANLLKK